MAKRKSAITKSSRSRKTAKRLAIKHAFLKAKAAKRGKKGKK